MNIICQCCGEELPVPRNKEEEEFQINYGCGDIKYSLTRDLEDLMDKKDYK